MLARLNLPAKLADRQPYMLATVPQPSLMSGYFCGADLAWRFAAVPRIEVQMSSSIIASMQSYASPNKLQANKTSSALESAKPVEQTAEEKFLDYAKKSPAEKIRDALLKSVGVTEEQLKNMTPEQRKEVEQKIADKIKEAMQKQAEKGESTSGFFTDIKA